MWSPLWRNGGGQFADRMRCARAEGSLRGTQEGKLFLLAVGKNPERSNALDWLNTAVDEGRAELAVQHATEREIELWEMARRISFLLEIV